MTIPDLVKNIRADLNEIHQDKSSHNIQSTIHSVTRLLNKLAMQDESKGKVLRKFSVDLMQAFTAEVQFHNLNARKSPGAPSNKLHLTESFFRSYEILKKDMIAALEKF